MKNVMIQVPFTHHGAKQLLCELEAVETMLRAHLPPGVCYSAEVSTIMNLIAHIGGKVERNED